uniref:Uncharacterized protein n=1 Tax=Anopheles arabiensis TaxID=7173 RepID=A0A182IDB9_ANOAR
MPRSLNRRRVVDAHRTLTRIVWRRKRGPVPLRRRSQSWPRSAKRRKPSRRTMAKNRPRSGAAADRKEPPRSRQKRPRKLRQHRSAEAGAGVERSRSKRNPPKRRMTTTTTRMTSRRIARAMRKIMKTKSPIRNLRKAYHCHTTFLFASGRRERLIALIAANHFPCPHTCTPCGQCKSVGRESLERSTFGRN